MLEQSLVTPLDPSGNPVGRALPPGQVLVVLGRVLGSCYSLEILLANNWQQVMGEDPRAEHGISTLLQFLYRWLQMLSSSRCHLSSD